MNAPPPEGREKIALICGGGQFPIVAARAAQAAGREVFVIGLRGVAGPEIEAFDHTRLGIGQLGGALRELSQRGIRDVCFIGGLTRPELSQIRLDWGAIRRLPAIRKLFRGGDDHALKGVARLFESEGFRVVGVDAFAPDLLAWDGAINGVAFPEDAQDDLAFARKCLDALSAFDCGQALVVAKRRIIAIEAAEGTDAMIRRVAELRASGRWGVRGAAGFLVKAPKQGQDLRLDMPAIGPGTIAAASAAGLRGLALAAGAVLILDRAAVVAEADKAGLFLHGFAP